MLYNEKKSNKIAITAIAVIIIGLAGKIFGFLRELLLARYFGTSQIVDIYLMSITIPSLFFGFLPAIGVGVTPIFYSVKTKERNKFLNNVLCISIIIACLCIIATYFFSAELVAFVANGFDNLARNYTEQFLLVTVWSVLLNTPIQILISYLNCQGSYINSNIANLTVSIIQALFVVIAAKINVALLPYGYLMPFVVQFIWLFSTSCRYGFRPCPGIRFDDSIKRLFILVIPIFISNMLVDLNGFVDKYLASSLPEGRISSLNYAFTLRAVFYTLCTTVITTIFYPKISKLVTEKKSNELLALVNSVIDILIILFLPLQVFCIICAKDIVNVVLMRGNFNQNSLELTMYPFAMYMISLVFISIIDLIIKIFYAKGDSVRNLLYGGMNIGCNIVVSICLVKTLGHTGLALGTSISAIIIFPLYINRLSKEVDGFKFKIHAVKIIKVIIGCCTIGIFLLLFNSFNIMGIEDKLFLVIRLLLQSLGSFILYFFTLSVLNVREIRNILLKIKERL